MPELRWTLLLLGALFIAILAWSERRKARQATRSSHEPTVQDGPAARVQREPTLREPTLREPAAREPTLNLPELRARDPLPPHDLPVVQVDTLSPLAYSTSNSSSRLGGRPLGVDILTSDTLSPDSGSDSPPSGGRAPGGAESIELDDREQEMARMDGGETHSQLAGSASEWDGTTSPDPIVADLPVLEVADEGMRGEGMPSTLIVEWPPEEDRQIIALRLVSVSPDRFSGRAIRTALVAEGFVHGKFSIFHKPDAHQRAMLSAASLSKPGIFDLETIDTQRFSGLNLFAVIAGGQPGREAFEQLLACARNLNERLEGGLQDDRGGPLTPGRIAALRESLGAAPARLN